MFPEPAVDYKQTSGAFIQFAAVKRVVSVHGVCEAGVLPKYRDM
jgi:hypothetical protein